jgi:threonine/homoserine/homoserine lactone efflux protein
VLVDFTNPTTWLFLLSIIAITADLAYRIDMFDTVNGNQTM